MRAESPFPFPFRYRRLVYVALEVTDLPRSVAFYRDFLGLDVVQSDAAVAYLRCSRDRQNVVLYATPERACGLRRIAYQVDSSADLDVAFGHFERLGLDPRPVSRSEQARLHQGRSFRVREPSSGVHLELFAHTDALETSYVPGLASIIGLGHVVIDSPHEEETLRSLVDAFGFRVSDVVEGHRAFLRAHPDLHQCSVAVALGSRRAVPVVSFVVSDIDHLGRFSDPDGITIECNIAIDENGDDGGVDPGSDAEPSSVPGQRLVEATPARSLK
jgi:2,3-dihydroxy-p-cumate/2,3-dihydroxybenzoate 3,4-dioxygenase